MIPNYYPSLKPRIIFEYFVFSIIHSIMVYILTIYKTLNSIKNTEFYTIGVESREALVNYLYFKCSIHYQYINVIIM